MINISHPLYLHVADQERKRHNKFVVVLSLKSKDLDLGL